MKMQLHDNKAFTLIELSIVLVIIGLIVGGILVGRDLVNSAEVRSQIAQIESFQTAANTFRGKYGYLPGDIPEPYATQMGLFARGSYANGNSDGDGAIKGILEYAGEPLWFWIDLSSANLITGGFAGQSDSFFARAYPDIAVTETALPRWLPQAKLGNSYFIYVFNNSSVNYMALAKVRELRPLGESAYLVSYDTVPVIKAYNIDKKVDDGKPQHGTVIAKYINGGSFIWAGHDYYSEGMRNGDGTAKDDEVNYIGDSTSCYHNPSSDPQPQSYAITTNANSGNCALSFKLQ